MALIKSLDQLKPYLPVAYSNSIASLPSFDSAEERYLIPIIGTELYAVLQACVDSGIASAIQGQLLQRCRAVTAPFAYLAHLPFIQTQLTANGLIAMEADNSRKAFKWEYNEVKLALEDRGFSAQEALISFLRSHLQAFDEWKTAPYNQAQRFGLIRNGEDLGSIVGLQYPQRAYMLLKPIFRMVEDLYLIRNLGRNFYAVLNSRVLDEQISGEEDELLRSLRPAVARWALAVASQELSIRFGDNGFTITDGRVKDNIDEGRVAASEAQLRRFYDQMLSTATQYIGQSVEFLNRTASEAVFGEWWISTLYVNPLAPVGVRRKNDERRGFFVAG